MNEQFTIFFSWQSDVKPNRKVIKKGIDAAFSSLKEKNGWTFHYDESTRDESGSPDIPSTVLKKIENCDVFIADITPITIVGDKALPNPNVLTELGYALRCVGTERIIIVASNGDYKEYNLPFDINHFRIGKFNNELKTCDLNFEIGETAKYILDNGKFQYIRFFNESHLQQNICTGKYLRDVFIEEDELKEHLRYFVNPFFFYPKFYDETARLYFDYYKQKGELNDWLTFEFSMDDFTRDPKYLDFSQLRQEVEKISSYLSAKKGELLEGYTRGEYARRKIERRIESARYFASNVCVLTAKAGQGKTNLVCDLVDHVLLPHYIPFAYINGYEIDASNVATSIARMIYPEQDYSLGDLLKYIERFCEQQKKCFVLIIDGLNENANSALLCSNLQHLLGVLLEKEYIRVIMTCRTEYYKFHYSQLLSLFPRSIEIKDIYQHLQRNHLDVLMENYCRYFNIQARFASHIKKQLGDNLLVLRIFSEAYQNQNIGYVSHLQKEIFFTRYYQKMQQDVVTQFRQEGLQTMDTDIEFFMTTIVQLMIDKDSFVNVKMNDILRILSSEQKQIIYRFIDSNILIKRGIDDTLLNKDVVNFTFDEFRDFMIAHYMIDMVEPESNERFVELVNQYTESKHVLSEGVSCFLFLYAKESANRHVSDVMRSMDWYKKAFLNYIWEVSESMVEDRDIEDMSLYLAEDPDLAPNLVYNGRWKVQGHRINISILLDLLSRYDDEQLMVYIEEVWPNSKTWGQRESAREHLLNQTQEILEHNDFQDVDIHTIFEHLLYLAPFDRMAQSIYNQYYERFRPEDQIRRVYEHAYSSQLKVYIEQL